MNERIKAFLNRAAKAVTGGLTAGTAGVVVYMQSTPVDFGAWELYVSGLVPAFGTGFITYWTANSPANPQPAQPPSIPPA